MGLFTKKNKNSNISGEELLKKHKNGKLNDENFLQMFGDVKVYYSTPFGDHKDGSQRLFLLAGPNGTGYNPVFSSQERLTEFYEKVGRAAYLIIEGTFLSALETTKKTNDGETPVKMGLIIDPGYYDVTVDAMVLDKVIGIVKR